MLEEKWRRVSVLKSYSRKLHCDSWKNFEIWRSLRHNEIDVQLFAESQYLRSVRSDMNKVVASVSFIATQTGDGCVPAKIAEPFRPFIGN
jgi:hypothetical protein